MSLLHYLCKDSIKISKAQSKQKQSLIKKPIKSLTKNTRTSKVQDRLKLFRKNKLKAMVNDLFKSDGKWGLLDLQMPLLKIGTQGE